VALEPLSADQLGTLAQLTASPAIDGFYLAGGTATAFHLRHRCSRDLDLFSRSAHEDLENLRQRLVERLPNLEIVAMTDAALHARVGLTPVDVVRYPYPLLEAPAPGPAGFPTAGLLDLAGMKLSAVSRRGIRRDFWDLYAIVTLGGITLDGALDGYLARFGVKEADLYHVLRSLTYFEDAEREPVFPEGLSEASWETIKDFFRNAAPAVLAARV
jgi:hypothetical protein